MTDDSGRAVTIEQFAAVQAAVQDDLVLEEALEEQKLDPRVYARDRPHVLAEITSNTKAFAAYEAALVAAQDGLFRPIEPLYDDPAAWLAYNETLTTGPTANVLEEHGLTLGDMARLDRSWRRRFAADPDLAKKARADAKEMGLVPLTIGSRRATAQTTAASMPRPTLEDRSSELFEEVEQLAIIGALLGEDASESAFVSRGFASRADAQSAVAELVATIGADAALMSHFRRRAEHAKRLLAQTNPQSGFSPRISPPMWQAAPQLIHPPADDATNVDQTAPAREVDLDEVLPFIGSASAPASIADEVATEAAAGETAFLDGSALEVDVAPPSSDRFSASQQDADVDETGLIDALLLEEAVLPFDPSGAVQLPPVSPADLGPDLSGDTAFVHVAMLDAGGLPFEAPNDVATDVRRYASYVTTLHLSAEAPEQTMRAFGVSPAEHPVLIKIWQDRLAANDELSRVFDEACEIYRAWLSKRGGPVS